MKEHKIIREIQILQEKGLIPLENVESIQSYYETQKKINPKYAMGATSVAGILLVLAGAILIVSNFWANFPVYLKLLFAAAPLMAAVWAGFFTFTSGKGRAWREFSAVLTVAGSAFLAAMIDHIYGLVWCDDQSLIRLTMLIALILIYLFGSGILTVAYCIGLFFIVGPQLIEYIGVILVLPYLLTHLRQKSPGLVAMRYTALILGAYGFLNFGLVYPPLAAGTLFVLFLFGGWEIYQRNRESIFRNPWLAAGFIGFVTFLVAGGNYNNFYYFSEFRAQSKLFYWLSTGGLLAILAAVFPRRRWDAKRIIPLIMVLGMIIPLNQAVDPLWMRIFIIVTGVLFALASISNGIRKAEPVLFDGGLIVLAIVAYCRFFDREISVTIRAIGLVSLGSLFILANIIFFLFNLRREKRLKAAGSVAPEKNENPEQED